MFRQPVSAMTPRSQQRLLLPVRTSAGWAGRAGRLPDWVVTAAPQHLQRRNFCNRTFKNPLQTIQKYSYASKYIKKYIQEGYLILLSWVLGNQRINWIIPTMKGMPVGICGPQRLTALKLPYSCDVTVSVIGGHSPLSQTAYFQL